MLRIALRLASLALVLAAMAFVGACGGGDDDEGGGGDQGGTPATTAREGGESTINLASFPDFLDPQLSYTVAGIQELQTVYLSLLGYNKKPGAEGAKLVPNLAEAMPEVSEDGKTYKLKLRSGLKYSDGSAVKASDFEHAIKRLLNLESGGSSFYLGIVGASEYVEAGKARGDISGITTDDATGDITIELTEPNGQFPYILGMWFAAPIPSDTPFENQTKNPPPGTGPFHFASVELNRGFTLEKNPNYVEIPGVPAAKLDRLKGQVVKNATRQVQDVLQNRADYLDDPPSNDALRQFRQSAKDRYRDEITNSTYFFFLNHRTKPFDDVRVRQAVAYGIDKRALARLFGGQLEPGCNFLPPGMQGYKKIDPCPYGDPRQAPNVAKAKQLIQEAGAEGTEVTVYGNDEEQTTSVTEYLADAMNSIGLKARPRIVEASVYFPTVGNQKTRAQAGFTNWFQDFPHPGNFLFLIDGDSIQETNNQNFGNVDDPEINKAIDEANRGDLTEVAGQYAEVDRRLVEQAHVIPYGHRKIPFIMSDRMAFDQALFHPVLQADFTTFALKQGQ
jgi:peptide/nickel transport system substrate-binding protein